MGRRARKKEAKENALLKAARELFEERGFHGTTTRAIAERADVAAGTVFNYFPTKRSILARIFLIDVGEVRHRAVDSVDSEAPVIDQLMAVFTPFFAYYAVRPGLARVIVKELMFIDGAADRAAMFEFTVEFILELTQIVGAAQERGQVAEHVVPAQVAYHAFALYSVGLITWLGGFLPSREALEFQFRSQLQLWLDSIAPRP